MSWITWALLSALFAGATAVLAKVGVKDIDSDLAPAIRTLGFIASPPLIEPFAAAGADIIRLWPDWIAPEAEHGAAALIARIHTLGKPAWTTAGPAPREALLALIRMGFDGILTDTPDVLTALLAEINTAREN